jgi:NTE family protein
MRIGLVLGGGGLIGLGFHAGALKALDERGIDVRHTDVIVGTSAGAIIAGYLASAWRPADFIDYANGTHPAATADPHEHVGELRQLFTPTWSSRSERLRRGAGSVFVMASSRGLVPVGGRRPAAWLRRFFPAGMYSTAATRSRLGDDLPESWPRDGVYLCAAEMYSGKRVVFGAPGAPEASFPDAVLASTAIPGFFEAVGIAGHHYVDGGVVSATSLDVATDAGCDAILCIAPLGYRKDVSIPFHNPLKFGPVAVRIPFARTLRREVRRARERGIDVAVIRPWVSDLEVLGSNSMRHHDRSEIAELSRRGVHRTLDDLGYHPVVAAFADRAIEADRGK